VLGPSRGAAWRRGLLLLVFAGSACRVSRAFECASSDQCTSADGSGRCESTGYCSFADPGCPSGRRYGDRSGDDVGGRCVEESGPDAGHDYVANGTFESGTAGWAPYQATLTTSTPAHTGDLAALLCADGDATLFSLLDSPDSIPDAAIGESYAASAWVRRVDVAPAPLARIALREPDGDLETASAPIALDDTWQQISVERTVETASSLAVLVTAQASEAAACLLIDDVSIVRR
jgi:hypothetical protein